MIIWKIAFWILVAALVFHLLTKRFLNPFKFTMVVGKKGSGKTTWMVELIYKYLRRGWVVYANIDIPGVRLFDPEQIGKFTFPPGSAVFIDEANLFWDNRNWKQIAVELIEWFRYQRQYKVRLYMFSQTFDIDKKLRALCDDLFLVKNVARVFCWCKRIRKWPDLKQAEGESEARIVDMIEYDTILLWPFGSRHMVYIPRWCKYFKSYNPPPLEIMPSIYAWDADRAPKWLRKRAQRADRQLRSSIVRRILATVRGLPHKIMLLYAWAVGHLPRSWRRESRQQGPES